MKLHLPTILRKAVLVTIISISVGNLYAEDIKLGLSNAPLKPSLPDEVELNGNDRMGYIDGDGNLYTEFKVGERTENVTINKNLDIAGKAQVAVGGGSGSTLGTLTVKNGTVTVSDNGYLTATKTNIKDLVINDSGKVELHTNGGEKGIDAYGSGNNSYTTNGKMAIVSNSVTINGGSLTCGVANGAYVTDKYATKHATTGFKGSINQTGGTMSVRGDSALSGAFTINQTGTKTSAMYFTDNLNVDSTLTINQSNDNGTLIIGRLTNTSTWGSAKNVQVNQTGGGYIQLAQGSYFGKSSTIDVSQSGSGFIDIGGNISADTAKAAGRDTYYDTNRPNTFTDNNTTYTLNQTGSTGIINVKAAITVTDLVLDTGAELNLTNKLTLNDSDIDVFVTGNTDKGIVLGSKGSLELTEATVSFHLSEAAVQSWFVGAEESTITQTITLISGMSDAFAATLLGENGLLSLGEFDIATAELTRVLSGNEYYDIKDIELVVNKVDNDNKLQAVVTVENVPEPTTATLSLLALAALAARRRRK